MNSIRVESTDKLYGDVTIQGCKNAVLPILAATLLNKKQNVIHNCPMLSDVEITLDIIKSLGVKACLIGSTAVIDSSSISDYKIQKEMMGKLRSSIVLVAPVLSRCKKAVFTMPGGCEIGTRPIDIHLAAFEKMGVDVECSDGIVNCNAKNIHGADIHLPVPSVGATENVMLLACVGKGVTNIYNAAKEPEICDLAQFLNSMGARVFGAGTETVTIYAVKDLDESEYTVMPDRIEAITFACACACCGGVVNLHNINYNHISNVMMLMQNMGLKVAPYSDKMIVSSKSKLRCPNYVSTRPYPGFPTDAQSILMSVMSMSEGSGKIVENIFENRLKHAYELVKMGADIEVLGNSAFVTGKTLTGGTVDACDLRSGAALVIAALGSDGESVVNKCEYIDRGYDSFVPKLKNLGARIERVKSQ